LLFESASSKILVKEGDGGVFRCGLPLTVPKITGKPVRLCASYLWNLLPSLIVSFLHNGSFVRTGCIVGDQEAGSYSLRQQTKQDLQRWKQTETLYCNGINWQPAYYILGKKSCPQILRPIWFGRAVM